MSDDTPVHFSQAAAQRIAAAVKKMEKTDLTGNPTATQHGATSFFARLTGRWGHGNSITEGWRWSWVKIVPNPKSDAAHAWLLAEPHVEGEENAIELCAGPSVAEPGDIVLMTYAGADAAGESAYAFTPPGHRLFEEWVRNHDHRDNANGGHAFAVFHPGTQLPQQPWAI